MTDLDCQCGQNIIKKGEAEAKLRCKLIRWDRNGMAAVCKSCGKEVPITIDLLKSIQSSFVYEIGKDQKD